MPNLMRHKLPPSALALVGFSQGTMMALHVGLRRAAAPAAIVGYSGLLVVPPDGDPGSLRRRDHIAPAGAAGPRRPRRSDPAAGAVPGDRKASPRSKCRSNGTCRPASATASTPKACAMAASFCPPPRRKR